MNHRVRFTYPNCIIDGWINNKGELTDQDGVILVIREPLQQIEFLDEKKEIELTGVNDFGLDMPVMFDSRELTSVGVGELEMNDGMEDVELDEETREYLASLLVKIEEEKDDTVS